MRRSESTPLSTFAGRPAMRPRRMLAVVALAGSAALLAACASPGTSPTTAPPEPSSPAAPAGATGAAPVELGEELLQSDGLFDEVSAEGYAVRWLEVGASVAVVIGGSGGGGGCIPQPQAAEQGDTGIVVRFDPPDPAMMCTADFRLHGWELGLAAPVDPSASLPVQLVDLRGEDETTELEIGPDDVLVSGPTADPQPSVIDDPPVEGAGEPVEIPQADLPAAGLELLRADPPVRVHWIDPGRELAVLLGGSGTAACVPTPTAARVTGPMSIEVSFEPAAGGDCSADAQTYGWRFVLGDAISTGLGVEVTVTGAGSDGATSVATLAADDVLALP